MCEVLFYEEVRQVYLCFVDVFFKQVDYNLYKIMVLVIFDLIVILVVKMYQENIILKYVKI